MNADIVRAAFQATGAALRNRRVPGPIDVVVCGGVAGLLGGWLRAGRTTTDCDVVKFAPESTWLAVSEAVVEAAAKLDLPTGWLNRECGVHAWCLPLGWESRCEPVECFGPLVVRRIARLDLIAAKVVSSPRRPQDLEDLRDLAPTGAELSAVMEHLDRLARESLDIETFDAQRSVVNWLRGES